jgi:drug/metabolite transporter (DMT)-like permease
MQLYHARPSSRLPSRVVARQGLLLSNGRKPVWIAGIVLVALASLADLVALAYAPQSIVAPLGSITLVANVFFSPYLLGEKISRLEIKSTTIIITGSVISVWFASHEEVKYT